MACDLDFSYFDDFFKTILNPDIENIKNYLRSVRYFLHDDEKRLQTLSPDDSDFVLNLLSSVGIECGKLFHKSVWFYLNKNSLAALEAAM